MKLFCNYSKQVKVEIGYACNIIIKWKVQTKLFKLIFFYPDLKYQMKITVLFKPPQNLKENQIKQILN